MWQWLVNDAYPFGKLYANIDTYEYMPHCLKQKVVKEFSCKLRNKKILEPLKGLGLAIQEMPI